MSKDSLRGLVQLVSGLGELTTARANQAARDLISLAGLEDQLGKKKLAKQVQSVSQEILQAAEANRAQIAALVRSEVESAMARADLARVVDLDAAKATTAAVLGQVEELTNRLRGLVPGGAGPEPEVSTDAPAATPDVAAPSTPAAPARKRPARRSFAAAAEPAPAAEPVKAAPAKKAPAKKAGTAKAAPAKAAAPAKKTPAKKAPAKAVTQKATGA